MPALWFLVRLGVALLHSCSRELMRSSELCTFRCPGTGYFPVGDSPTEKLEIGGGICAIIGVGTPAAL